MENTLRLMVNTLTSFLLSFCSACFFLAALMCMPLLCFSNFGVCFVCPGYFLLVSVTEDFFQARRGAVVDLTLFTVFFRELSFLIPEALMCFDVYLRGEHYSVLTRSRNIFLV